MRYILIANTGTYPSTFSIVTSNNGHQTTYMFRDIWTMDDAYKLQGMELYDLVWGHVPNLPEVQELVETRVRSRAGEGL